MMVPVCFWGGFQDYAVGRRIARRLLRGELVVLVVAPFVIRVVRVRHPVAAPPVDEGDAVL